MYTSYRGFDYAPFISECKVVKKYGFFNFMFDVVMVAITAGLWLIWIFVREMRRR
jgi:hypothetical protein